MHASMHAPGKLEAAVALGPEGERGDGATADDQCTYTCAPTEPHRLLPILRPFVSGMGGGTTVHQARRLER